jgi:putative tryptophan/tyrosine transport system substrate-binding protein
MRRRRAIALLGGVTLAYSSAGRAQQPARMSRIGLLADGPLPEMSGLREGLRDLGYVEGVNVHVEHRWAYGRRTQYQALAVELVKSGVDVIVTWGTPATLGAQAVTSDIPIVTAAVGDPLGSGIVPNLARPGGNTTGFASLTSPLFEKRVELVREIVPSASRVSFLFRAVNLNTVISIKHAKSVAETLGVSVLPIEIEEDVEIGLSGVARERPDAVLVSADPFLRLNGARIIAFMAEHGLPAVYASADHVAGGGLISLGVNYHDLFRRAAGYVDRILKGARPGDLPMQQAERFQLAINLRTAKALGLTIPPTLLARADEVIE